MNKLFYLIILLPNLTLGQSNKLYKLTLDSIKNTSEFIEFSAGQTDEIQVMPELIPFYEIGFGFFDELQQHTGLDYSNRNNLEEIVKHNELCDLSDRRRSKLKLWFSKIEDDVVIAELAYARSKNHNYYNYITNFGLTLVFFARFNNGELIELQVQKRHNN